MECGCTFWRAHGEQKAIAIAHVAVRCLMQRVYSQLLGQGVQNRMCARDWPRQRARQFPEQKEKGVFWARARGAGRRPKGSQRARA